MNAFFHLMMELGGLAAAAAVGAMCLVCLVVWFGGGTEKHPSEAWRAHVDES